MNKDDSQGELRNVLLEGEVAINGNEYVELNLRQCQELAVRYARPASIVNGLYIQP